MITLHPAYEIRYREFVDEVFVYTFSVAGKPHSGEPKRMKWENLPAFVFQLVDAGYVCNPREKHLAFTSVTFFSPAFVLAAKTEQGEAGNDGR